MASNVLVVKGALKTLLDTLAGTETYQKTWGPTSSPEKLWIYLGKVEWNSSEWMTNRSREEDFTIEVVINVVMNRASGQEAETEAARVSGLIEQMVTNNPNLGIAQVVTTDYQPVKLGSWPAESGVIEAQLEAGIRVTARFSRGV